MRAGFELKAVAVALGFVAWDQALSNPTGPTVVNGAATFATSGPTLTVTNGPNAIISWQGFSIGAGEATLFNQPSAASAVLNRVTSQDPSSILGALRSNGRVFLINPNGITFGEGAVVDVAGLVASSLNLSNTDFLSGRMRFVHTPGAGPVVNNGSITTSGANAPVYLVGPSVTNGGVITSPRGEVILAAGDSVEVLDPATPDVTVQITAPGNQVLNMGSVIAPSGHIGIHAGHFNQNGVVQATTAVAGDDGRIVLSATGSANFAPDSLTRADGTISTGGSIDIAARDVLISGDIGSHEQTIRASRNITLRPGPALQGGGLRATHVFTAGGPQVIEAGGTLRVEGDARGGASFQAAFAGGTQTIRASNIELVGTGEYYQDASLFAQVGQSITVTNGGKLSLQRNASISTGWEDQSIGFSSGGRIEFSNDSTEEQARARISSGRDQFITGSPDIGISAGAGTFSTAGISAARRQTIEAGNVTLTGGTGEGALAGITAPRQQIRLTGDLVMHAGSPANPRNARQAGVLIGSPSLDAADTEVELSVGGDATLTGGNTFGTRAVIGRTGGVLAEDSVDVRLTVGGNLILHPGTADNSESVLGWGGPHIGTGAVEVASGGNIALNSTGFTRGGGILTRGDVSLTAGNTIMQGSEGFINADAVTSSSLSVRAGGAVLLPGQNWVDRFDATAGGSLTFHNASPLVVTGIRLGNNGALSLRQGGDLLVTGEVSSGPQTFLVSSNMTLQGGSSPGARAHLFSTGDIDLTVGGELRLNSGQRPQEWARIQTAQRSDTITLHFPNRASDGWFVNGVEGAIRDQQSGFLSGNGAAVLGRTLQVTYGP